MDVEFEEDKTFILYKFFENTSDAVLITKPKPYLGDGHPEIVYVNNAFEEMTGYQASEVIGQSPRILQVDERDRSEREKIKNALQAWIDGDENVTARVELYNKTKSGIPFWVEISMFPIWNQNYSRSYWAAIQRNIDQKKYLENKLSNEVEYVNYKMKETEKFLANASHEMRTPLNAIIGFSDMMKSSVLGDLDEKKIKEYLGLIHKSGLDLKMILDQLLSAYKEDAFAHIQYEKTNLFEIISHVIQQCKADSDVYRGQDIVVLGEDTFIYAEYGQIRQVILNILYNSIKFTEDGGQIYIEINPCEDFIDITISDNGCGIPAANLRSIFAPFSVGVGTIRNKRQGTGLGLALSKKIVEAHGGTINIKSEEGRGTIVTVRLKYRP